MTERISRKMLIEYLAHGAVVHEDLNVGPGLGRATPAEPISVVDAIAADLAFDDAIAAAIERFGKSNS